MRFRRRKRRWAAPVVVLLSALLFGFFAELDLDAFRGRAVDGVSAWLDQPVVLGGRLGLRMSDGPVLVLPEIEVGDRMVKAREARIAVRFWPLLIGHIEPRSVTLIEPKIRLAAFAIWRKAAGEWPTLPLERLEIVDGLVETPDGAVFDQLSLTVTPSSPSGPFDVRGTARGGGEALRLESTVGRLEAGRPVGFAAKLQAPGFEAALAGAANRGPAGLEVGGPLKVTAGDAAKSLARLGIVEAPLQGPAALEAKFAWAAGRVTLTDLTFESADTRATGRIDLTESLRSGEIQLAIGRLEIERWRETVAALSGGAGGRDLSLVISADAVSFRGALLRQARAELRLLQNQVAVRQLAVLAPGGTELTLFGRISSTDANPSYEGEADLTSDNLRVALAWLGIEPAGIAPDRLRRASVSLRMSFDGRRLTVPSFDLKLDTSRMLGSGNLVVGPSPRFDLRVAVDRVTLDPYLPLIAGVLASSATGTFAASSDLMTWQGIGFRDVEVEAEIADSVIDLRRLRIAEAAGARFAVAGRVVLEGAGSDISFDLSTTKPAEFLRLFGNGDAPIPADATMTAAGRLQGSLSDLRLSGAIVTSEGTGNLDGSVDLAGPSAPAIAPGPDLRGLIERLAARGR